MVRLFDTTFITGSVLVIAALAVAFLAATREDLPIVGTGIGALLLVALLGVGGCAVAGVSQAPVLGWTAPTVILGTVLGIVALVIIAAGIFGWTAVLQPIAAFLPGQAGVATSVRTAILALGVLIAVKWAIGIVMAAAAR